MKFNMMMEKVEQLVKSLSQFEVLWMIQMYFDVAGWCKWNRELDRIMIDIYE